jgi:class 3 adenylate cyclase/tetratricopeptide (TPR) repeat protein
MKFCGECGTRLAVLCAACGARNAPSHKFCGECGARLGAASPVTRPAPQQYTPKHLAERILTSKTALEGERKQVTVLFADLQGSMELLADRDPEEARKILDPVLELMMEAVHRFEGTVNQVMGDGIMALFGAPIAHEDHAVRACYAALRMQDSVKTFGENLRREEGVTVRIRVGLHSGEVVVRAVGNDLHMDYTAVGHTTHLAARMEQLAEPGTSLLTMATLALAEGFIHVTPLGPMRVKGLGETVEVSQLIAANPVRTRFQVHAARGLTTFVGRTREMSQIVEALELARGGRGQIVAVVGEPGVGKSRLFWEFAHSQRVAGCRVVGAASVSYGKSTAYLPVGELLRAYFESDSRDDPRRLREKVTGKLLSLDRALEPALPALLALLDVPLDDVDWEPLEPAQRRQQTLEAVKRLLLRESHVQPLVVIVEDAHWVDSETQAVLDGLVDSLSTSRLLLLVSYRPEYQHAWGTKPNYRELRLDTLPMASAEELLGNLLGGDPVLESLKGLLITRTEGNPFFLEESVRTLVETGVLVGQRGAYALTRPIDAVDIPSTVQTILAARIDRLFPEDKSLLQTAAVIGYDVPHVLLEAVGQLPESELRDAVRRLEAAEFLYELRLFPDVGYTFRHALTHDVAYGSLLHDRRRELHAQILAALERLDPERAGTQLEHLAHHAFCAETWEKALRYCRDAAHRAFARSAHAEGLHHVEQALEALERMDDVPERAMTELQLVMQRAGALRALRGYAAPELVHVYTKAGALSQIAGNVPDRFGIEWQQMQFFLVRGDMESATTLASRLLAYAEARGERVLVIDAQLALGMVLFHEGEFSAARAHFERGVQLYREDSDEPNLETHGQDPGVFCLSYLAYSLWFLGLVDQAVTRAEMAMDIARRKAHAFSYVSALTFATRVHQCRRDLLKVTDLARETTLAAAEHGFSYYEALGMLHMGWARVMIGGDETAGALLLEGYKRLEKTGTVLGLQGARVQLAEAYNRLGEMEKVVQALDESKHDTPGRGTRCWDAEVARLRAELFARGSESDSGAAIRWYENAIDIARRQGAKSLELRAALSYATMLNAKDRRVEACDILDPIARSFTEGDDALEIREARALLAAGKAGQTSAGRRDR